MNRATPALLAFLLAFSLVAVPVAAGPADETRDVRHPALQEQVPVSQEQVMSNQSVADQTTQRLSLEGETRSEYVEYGADLSALLASTDDELRADYTTYVALDHEFETASVEEREAMVEEAYDRITERATELEERERVAVRAHAEGDLSTTQLLQQLLRNHYEAAALSDALNEVEDRAAATGYSLDVQDDQNALEMYRTPVRTQLEQAARGLTEGSVAVAVETSQTGYVISYLDGEYVREATRFDNWNPDRESRFENIGEVNNYVGERYPWVGEPSMIHEHPTVQLYLIRASHDQGELEAYLDGATGDVYREVQVLNPGELPKISELALVGEELKVSLTETPRNGPVEAAVTDAETGEPVTATVEIGGVEIGTTDRDGTIRFAPLAKPYDLTVTANGASLEATVSD